MPEQMEIDLSLGIGKILEGINRAAEGAQRLTDNTKKAGDAAKVATGPFQQLQRAQEARARAGVMGATPSQWNDLNYNLKRAQDRVSGIVSPAARTPGYSSGPNQRLAALREQRARAGRDGAGPDVLSDLDFMTGQAQKRVDRINQPAQPAPDFSQRLTQAFLSSRFGIGGGPGGGGIQPLVGKSLEAIGGSGAAGMAANLVPWLLLGKVALMAADGVKKLAESAVDAAEITRRYSMARVTSGTSSAEAGQVSVFGNASGTDLAGLSRSFHDRITSDPFSMGIASRYGVHGVGGPFGTLDTGKELLRFIQGLRSEGSRDAQLRAMRATGTEGLDVFTKVSNKTMARLKADADTTSEINNPEQERKAAELEVAMKRAQGGTEAVKTAFGHLFSPGTTDFLNWYADLAYGFAGGVNSLDELIDKSGVRGKRGSGNRSGTRANGSAAGGGWAGDSHQAALEENNEHLEEVSRALGHLTRAVGGGDRAARAIPPGLQQGDNLRRAMETRALRLQSL